MGINNIKSVDIVAALLFENKKVLVAKTKNGEWEFPGGKVKEEEKYEDALIREIKEELNINVEAIEEVGSVEIDINENNVNLFSFILVKGETKDIKLSVHTEYKFVDLNELKQLNLSKADKTFIELYKDKFEKLFN